MMKRILFCVILLMSSGVVARAQQTSLAADENMKPDAFTQALKTEWTFLRDEIDKFVSSTKAKDEFETTVEFERRQAKERADLVTRVRNRMEEQKFPKRVLKVLLKANPKLYDADTEVYTLICNETIEAPYNIPTVVCYIPSNRYVMLSDSVEGGFRFSKITFNFGSEFKWHVTRDIAKMAKAAQNNLYFRIHFVIDANVNFVAGAPQAVLTITPKLVELVDVQKNQVFWKDTP
ncbi:MAG: hypothetical protein KBG83_04710 [Bacteroidetes bacterium]|nr:hypothetical protein [Bacteroidota bacterium]HOV98181.1 hypothetical protein [Bacteroidota bacterium]